MKRDGNAGFTLVEIMIVVAIIALLAAIAIRNVLRGRTTANESAAIGKLRALVSSLEMARSVNQAYPDVDTWFAGLYGTSCTGAAGDTVDPDFGPPSFCLATLNGGANDRVQGYIYDYTGGAAPAGTYTLTAWPLAISVDGTRSFFANQTGLIRHCRMAAQTDRADATDVTIDAAPNAC